MEPVPGVTAFGPYRVLKEIGRGGMGAVYEVTHPGIPRPLALKLILETVADEDALARFEREAQLLGQVRHKNVLVVNDYGRSKSGPYLVTDLVEGESLRQRLFDGPLEPAKAARIVRDLADALVVVHSHGILHRDIKPDNVLLQPDGTPVLLDFGLARELGGERLTLTGQIVGTPAYMAPEQASGTTDERTDVYGLGALLYALLAGHQPFDGPNHVRVLTMVMTEEPTWPSATREGVPPELEAVVRVAMAKAPEARHGTARDLRDDLDRYLRDEPTWAGARVPELAANRARARRRRRTLAVAIPGAALLVGAVAALAIRVAMPPDTERVVDAPVTLEVSAPKAVAGHNVELVVTVRGEGAGAVRLGVVGSTARVEQARPGTSHALPVSAGAPGETHELTVFAQRGARRVAERVVRVRRWAPRKDGKEWPAPPKGMRLGSADGDYVNDVDGSILLFVPPGKFRMSTRLAQSAEFSSANVEFAHGFFIGKTEVSRAQWAAYVLAEKVPHEVLWDDEEPADLPITHVSRDEARAYCKWAALRLPGDAEWEYAARGPDALVFPWGNALVPGIANSGARDEKNSHLTRCGEMLGDRSPFGCMDMGGNVHEWVDDEYLPDSETLEKDPRGARDGPGVPRGGSWSVLDQDCRGAARVRTKFEPNQVGFRVARDLR